MAHASVRSLINMVEVGKQNLILAKLTTELEIQETKSSHAIEPQTPPSTRHIALTPPSHPNTALPRDRNPSLDTSMRPSIKPKKRYLVLEGLEAKTAKTPELNIGQRNATKDRIATQERAVLIQTQLLGHLQINLGGSPMDQLIT